MKILVPTDFSELSLKAIQAANTYASIFGGKISLFNSHIPITELDEPYALGMSNQVYQDYESIENSIRERLTILSEENVDEKYRGDLIVHVGNPAQSIVEEAEAYDLIIMSTHGRTGFSRLLLGSVAEKVLRLSKIPVMVVENESEIGSFKNILVTTDFSENAEAAFPHALNIAKKTGGNVDVLHILSLDQFEENETDPSVKKIREQRMKLIEKEHFHELDDRVKSYTIVSEDSPHEAILKFVKGSSYNLIVMATVGKTGINYMMMGSTTANVVRHVKTAVLSVKPPSLD
ncbi:universal stress protein [Rhodohalobacter sp. SW132]|uniref:universal stress protein n=1 Tax=Rhodohalobacter sp. SW132 TaxID=2293433 RepID=UPI000E273ACC|nr:universal stress protein [Rhodohalobacter sp. SW132]REL33558.1 universal stress protein [Rhodohalobacter sp. SW132]